MPVTIYDYTYELPDQVSDNGKGAEEIEAEADIYWLLKRLPERQRECFNLLLDGYTHKQIADRLKVTKGTVDRYIFIIQRRIQAEQLGMV